MVPVDLQGSPAPLAPVLPRETEVIPGCRASPAPLLGRESQDFLEAPVIMAAQGSRGREARPATVGVLD